VTATFWSRLGFARSAEWKAPGRAHRPVSFRPCVEGFEDRVVPAAPVFNAAKAASMAQADAALPNLNITGVQLTSFQIVNNVLKAAGTVTGTLAGLPFTTTITDFALSLIPGSPTTPGAQVSVLHLQLAPIHLTLLGLHVDTSQICLNITATQGGGLLGDLLGSLAGGSGGLGLPTIPTAGQTLALQNGLTDVLNGTLNSTPAARARDSSVCTGRCDVLHLNLGPLNLSLLGLNVSLDDCSNGPVQVCLSATRREGLLGRLLCSLSGPRALRVDLADLTQLVSSATNLLSDGALSGRDAGALASRLAHLAAR